MHEVDVSLKKPHTTHHSDFQERNWIFLCGQTRNGARAVIKCSSIKKRFFPDRCDSLASLTGSILFQAMMKEYVSLEGTSLWVDHAVTGLNLHPVPCASMDEEKRITSPDGAQTKCLFLDLGPTSQFPVLTGPS